MERMWLPTVINTSAFAASLFLYTPIAKITGIYSVPIVSFICSFVQLFVLLSFWGGIGAKRSCIKDFITAGASLIIFAPLGLFFSRYAHDWLLNAGLLHLIAYCALFSFLFFAASVALQTLLGSQSSSYIIFLLKKKIVKRPVNNSKNV